jgi:hypothetical protein
METEVDLVHRLQESIPILYNTVELTYTIAQATAGARGPYPVNMCDPRRVQILGQSTTALPVTGCPFQTFTRKEQSSNTLSCW